MEVAVLQYSVRCRIARAVATTERRTEELRDIAGKIGHGKHQCAGFAIYRDITADQGQRDRRRIFAFIPRSMKRL
jgi:hypothetical protein